MAAGGAADREAVPHDLSERSVRSAGIDARSAGVTTPEGLCPQIEADKSALRVALHALPKVGHGSPERHPMGGGLVGAARTSNRRRRHRAASAVAARV